MNRLGPLFTQEAKANMVAIYPSQSMVLQQVHFNWDCCLRKRGSEKGHELLNSLFSWNEAHSEPYMYTKHCLNTWFLFLADCFSRSTARGFFSPWTKATYVAPCCNTSWECWVFSRSAWSTGSFCSAWLYLDENLILDKGRRFSTTDNGADLLHF